MIKELFRYKKGGLNPRIISTMDTLEWTEETVLVDVPYKYLYADICILAKKHVLLFRQSFIIPHNRFYYSNWLEDMSD